MREGWRLTRWGDIASLEYGKRLEGYESGAGPYPVYGTNGLIGYHTKPLCEYPSVVIGRKGAYRGIHYSKTPFFVIDTAFYLRPKTSELDTLWAYYELRTRDINSMDSGSAIPSTSREEFYNLPVLLPPLCEQQAIADALGTLDDKIELNRQMNKTLEAIVQAIFKSWFVDFDPVRAKAEGRQPEGVSREIADLFPDRFGDSELGQIPQGWAVRPLADLIEILSGGTPRTSVPEYWDGNIPWFSIKDAPSNGDVFVIATEKCVTQAGLANSAAKVLPKGTTIITARGTVGKCALVGAPMAMNQSCYGIRGKPGYPEYFTHYTLRQAVHELQQKTHGTVFETITRQTFDNVMIVCPTTGLARAFDDTVGGLLERILANCFESRTLAQIRDTLLPRLLSGEIRVKDAETLVQDTV